MKRALVSTSDKTGLIQFLKPLVEKGLEIVSTGGTLSYLRENKINATDVSDITGFPEVLDGRVKTLHPHIHMGLLADSKKPAHLEQLKKHNVFAFDLVVGNLYPFESAALSSDIGLEELIEKIDIGGPSFLRASAKNYHSILVLCDPTDYSEIQNKILNNQITIADRKRMALKVFSLTSYYDALIVQKLSEDENISFNYLNLPLKKKYQLRYGENSQQQSVWYENPLSQSNLADAILHQGKELSYNNLLDLDAATGLVRLFTRPACVAVKHNNPCGVAEANTLQEAAQKAIQSDPKSIFGGIVAFNQVVDLECANEFKDIFLECIIAPKFTDRALEQLAKKKNLRVLSWSQLDISIDKDQFRSISGGLLRQEADTFQVKMNAWNFIGEKPNETILKDMVFAEKVCGYLKSNAIALVYKGQTVGLGMGQVNRVDAVQQALTRLDYFQKDYKIKKEEIVLSSDAFFPFADSIDLISKAGIRWIVQPGGSTKDPEVIDSVKNNKMNMALTHQRHFRH